MKSAPAAFLLLLPSAVTLIVGALFDAHGAEIANSASSSKVRSNPTPHIYQSGERLNPAYGPFTEISDWKARGLVPPSDGYHWVQYADTYLLIDKDSALIARVLMGSRPPGRV